MFGRIPGFTNAIFPAASVPNLTLVANLGLVLFLFLVGLEVDVRFLASNYRVAVAVGLGGMVLPFGRGCGIAWGLYNEFPATTPIAFGTFMLFIGVAMAITAFPVLCRILTELKLLGTPVGVIVLSAGVSNDVTGWILLALCVALVNAGSGLSALWILLTCVGYGLFLVFLLRPAFIWILKRTRSLQDGPSQGIVALTLLLVLASAFFTGVIGVHPIFGAFMIGVICPHHGGFAIKLTEKIEDIISALFLPLYFALSGLSTNLGLLNSGIVWAYVIAIIAVAFCGKFLGASLASRLCGLVWRESFAIGALMSCKGLVELIVLVSGILFAVRFSWLQNIGLQAKILTTQTFTMFVVMALVTTFATTPLTHALYPVWYQKKLEAWKRGLVEWDSDEPVNEPTAPPVVVEKLEMVENLKIRRMMVHLSLDNMPLILSFMGLLTTARLPKSRVHHSQANGPGESEESDPNGKPVRPIAAHGVNLVSLTERPSSVMQVSEIEEYALQDPIVNTFRTFGQLYNISTSGEVVVVPESSFSETLTHRASDYSFDMVFLPWNEYRSLQNSSGPRIGFQDEDYARFVLSTMRNAVCNTGVFISFTSAKTDVERPSLVRNKSQLSVRSFRLDQAQPQPSILKAGIKHVFCALLGGPDDLLALSLALQIVENGCTATVVRFAGAAAADDDIDLIKAQAAAAAADQPSSSAAPKLERRASVMEPTLAPAAADRDKRLFDSLRSGMSAAVAERVVFETVHADETAAELHSGKVVVERVASDFAGLHKQAGGLVVVGRNWELKGLRAREGGEAERCLGVVGMDVLRSGIKGAMFVVKAA